MNELDELRAWRRGVTGRVLVQTFDGTVRLIEFRGGGRYDAEYPSAAEALQALTAGCVHWVERRAPERVGWHDHKLHLAKPTPAPAPAPRVHSQTRRAVQQRQRRAEHRAAQARP